MDEKELIEKWREEFQDLCPFHENYMWQNESGGYEHASVESYWQGYLMAKRSIPVVELPKIGKGYYSDGMLSADDVIQAIESAGIPYKIKESS